MENSLTDEQSTKKKATTGDDMDRQTSVDSAAFYEAQDDYDDYDDFGASTGGGSGGSTMAKTNKRQNNRGGSGGSGSIYSSKHTRMKEAQRQKQSTKQQNKR